MCPFQKKARRCRPFKGTYFFKPRAVPLSVLEVNELELDELEAVHLCDYEDLSQAEASQRMNISSGTLQRLLYSGRKKLVDAVYSSKAIKINRHEYVVENSNELGFGRRNGRRGRRCSQI